MQSSEGESGEDGPQAVEPWWRRMAYARLAPVLVVCLILLFVLISLCCLESAEDYDRGISEDPQSLEQALVQSGVEALPSRAVWDRSRIEDSTPSRRGLRVTVVDAKSKKPVPGAEVWFWRHWPAYRSFTVEERRSWTLAESNTPFSCLERSGEMVLTNLAGVAAIPLQLGEQMIGARKGSLSVTQAFSFVGQEGDACTLVIRRQPLLRVQVVDAGGAPVSHAVVCTEIDEIKGRELFRRVVKSGPTDVDGLCQIRTGWELAEVEGRRMVRMWVSVIGGEGESQLIDLDVAREPVLRCPSTISVDIKAVSPFGEVCRLHDSPVALLPVHDFGLVVDGSNLTANAWNSILLEDGTVRFPLVAVPAELEAVFLHSTHGVSQNVSGSFSPGQHVEVEIDIGSKRKVFIGRLIGEGSVPLANQEFKVVIGWGEGRGSLTVHEQQVLSDSKGRFWTLANPHTISGTEFEPDPVGVVFLRLCEGLGISGKGAVKHGPFRTGPRVTDFGDLLVHPLGVIAAGQFVDAKGDGFWVRPCLETRSLEHPEEGWMDAGPGIEADCDVDGFFKITGDLVGVQARLSFEQNPGTSPLEVGIGATSLRVVVERRCQLTATWLMPTSLEIFSSVPSLISMEDPERSWVAIAESYYWGGATDVAYDFLAPGRYRLELRALEFEDPLEVVEDIIIDQPGQNGDERINFDLRGRLTRIVLTFVDSSGALVSGRSGVLRLSRPGRGRKAVTIPIVDQHVEFVCSATVNAAVEIKGYRTELITGLRASQQVILHALR